MSRLGYVHPQVLELATTVAEVVAVPGSGGRIRLVDDLFRPAGGGQPADKGRLDWDGRQVQIDDVVRRDGQTWLISATAPLELAGKMVSASIDAKRRGLLSRCHSLTHVLGGCLRRNLPDFASRGAEISEDGGGAIVHFTVSACSDQKLHVALAEARAGIANGARVEVFKAKSLEAAAARFPEFRVDPELTLSGPIRVVDIAGIDSNPCSGTHVNDIAEIEAFTANHPVRRGDDFDLAVRLVNKFCI